MQLDPNTVSHNRNKGETLVWLSASGLGLALLMVLFLLGLILVEGVQVFWPRDLVLLELQPETDSLAGQRPFLAGSIVEKPGNPGTGSGEWKLMVGNKDLYGTAYRFVPEQAILGRRPAEDLVVAERVEYGKAIFFPLHLITPSGERIEAGDPHFWKDFKASIDDVRSRFLAIQDLERNRIGALNRKIHSLERTRRHLLRQQRDGIEVDPRHLEDIEISRDALEEQFQELAAEVTRLRREQEAGSIHYRLASGQEQTQPLGNLLDVYRPNRMNVFQKGAFFLERIRIFLTGTPREANTEGGIFPAIFGTFVMTVLMSAAVMPFGVLAAIYLREYARQGLFVKFVRIGVNNLAGVPSIVYGVFGLGFFVYFLGGTIDQLFFSRDLPNATFGGGGILWASLTLALMTVPVVIVATEEALASVPRGSREASLASGASRWQTIERIVLPAAAPGILTGLILAMARGAGEVAPLMLVGVVKLAPDLPLDATFPFIHLERKFMHLGFHIYDLGFQSPDSESARPMVFATTLLLILLVIVLNLGAILLRNHLRAKYKTSTF